jgi:hypothetical protein
VQATQFEYRHPTLLSQLVIGLGLLTYLFDPKDLIWRFIEGYPNRRGLEHACFMAATLLIGTAALLCSLARGRNRSEVDPKTTNSYRAGEVLYAIGLGTLMPLAGFILVVVGQTVRVLRLGPRRLDQEESSGRGWATAIRKEAAKWGLLLTMAIFSVTLVDRQADYLAAGSYLVWAVLNLPRRKAGRRLGSVARSGL